MFLFRMTVTISYQTDDVHEIDLLYKNVDKTFQLFARPLGYSIVWGASKLSKPSRPMEQAVTESDTFVIERKFLQYKNVANSVKIFSGIIDLLGSGWPLNISWTLERDKIVLE